MKLFLLELKEEYVVCDGYVTHVVLARDEKEARALANADVEPSEENGRCRRPGDEGHIWANPSITTCTEIDTNGHQGLVASGFNAG